VTGSSEQLSAQPKASVPYQRRIDKVVGM